MIKRLPTYLVMLVGLLAAGTEPPAQKDDYQPARSLEDPRLAELRRAVESWRLREPPRRVIIDQVCLVPDVATFFAAVSTWDRTSWFPILLDDARYAPKFLRAFRPARVVRYGGRPHVSTGDLWRDATTAVGLAWDDPTAPEENAADGDHAPPFPYTPPGLVVSQAEAEALAGAVALAAGRFQRLISWNTAADLRFDKTLSTDQAMSLARGLEERIGQSIPAYSRLGDDCDFVTLAGDYPYRYEGGKQTFQAGPAAFDDLVGRDLSGPEGTVRPRWAFTGRLMGDAVASVYQAMCSLFLPAPRSAAIFDTYRAGPMYGSHIARPAEELLERSGLSVSAVYAPESNLETWHRLFDPVNRAGLVLVGTAGGASNFGAGPGGLTDDVPPTEPAAVHFIHSFSAADPRDGSTLAGRWLEQGAYAYFGSVHEPYLVAFRTPELVADLLMRGVPFGAAARLTPDELAPMGSAWRLSYLGDPLCRVDRATIPPRSGAWRGSSSWPEYKESPEPPAKASPAARLAWALRSALLQAAAGGPPNDTLRRQLVDVPRDQLGAREQSIFDALLADTSLQLGQLEALHDRLEALPATQRSASSSRDLATTRVALLQKALARSDWISAVRFWKEIVGAGSDPYRVKVLTNRIKPLATSPERRRELINELEFLAKNQRKERVATGIREIVKELSEGR